MQYYQNSDESVRAVSLVGWSPARQEEILKKS
jgi:hypothetical protein